MGMRLKIKQMLELSIIYWMNIFFMILKTGNEPEVPKKVDFWCLNEYLRLKIEEMILKLAEKVVWNIIKNVSNINVLNINN